MLIIKLTLLVFPLFTEVAETCEPVMIKIANGYIVGQKALTLTQNTSFTAFQGIPYAEAPVDDLRFRAPLPSKNWCGLYNATYERSECIQTTFSTQITGEENCLFINVYTPEMPQDGKGFKPRATLVWIHGGGFIFGSGNLGLHGADYFIDQDIIMVSFNYRLGLFGFLSTEDAACAGNYGLKDQIMALQWLQTNIKYFGGDRNNITIMGESAGSASIHFLIESDRAKGLFKGAIAESGSSLNPWTTFFKHRKLAFTIGVANLILTSNSTTLITKLRKIRANTLQLLASLPMIFKLIDPLNGLPFSPIIELESEEAVVTKKSYEALLNGNFNHVPLLHGYNSLEGRDVRNLPWFAYLLIGRYKIDSAKLCPRDMNATETNRKIASKLIQKYYFNNILFINNSQMSNYISDNEFCRGILKTNQFYAKYAPVYLYRFSYTGGRLHDIFNPEGVSHAEELQFLLAIPEWKQNTSQAIGMVHRMTEMWANFVKTGNPTSCHSKYVNTEWPVSNINYTYVSCMNIDVNMTVIINPDNNAMTFWDDLYKRFGAGVYNSYK